MLGDAPRLVRVVETDAHEGPVYVAEDGRASVKPSDPLRMMISFRRVVAVRAERGNPHATRASGRENVSTRGLVGNLPDEPRPDGKSTGIGKVLARPMLQRGAFDISSARR